MRAHDSGHQLQVLVWKRQAAADTRNTCAVATSNSLASSLESACADLLGMQTCSVSAACTAVPWTTPIIKDDAFCGPASDTPDSEKLFSSPKLCMWPPCLSYNPANLPAQSAGNEPAPPPPASLMLQLPQGTALSCSCGRKSCQFLAARTEMSGWFSFGDEPVVTTSEQGLPGPNDWSSAVNGSPSYANPVNGGVGEEHWLLMHFGEEACLDRQQWALRLVVLGDDGSSLQVDRQLQVEDVWIADSKEGDQLAGPIMRTRLAMESVPQRPTLLRVFLLAELWITPQHAVQPEPLPADTGLCGPALCQLNCVVASTPYLVLPTPAAQELTDVFSTMLADLTVHLLAPAGPAMVLPYKPSAETLPPPQAPPQATSTKPQAFSPVAPSSTTFQLASQSDASTSLDCEFDPIIHSTHMHGMQTHSNCKHGDTALHEGQACMGCDNCGAGDGSIHPISTVGQQALPVGIFALFSLAWLEHFSQLSDDLGLCLNVQFDSSAVNLPLVHNVMRDVSEFLMQQACKQILQLFAASMQHLRPVAPSVFQPALMAHTPEGAEPTRQIEPAHGAVGLTKNAAISESSRQSSDSLAGEFDRSVGQATSTFMSDYAGCSFPAGGSGPMDPFIGSGTVVYSKQVQKKVGCDLADAVCKDETCRSCTGTGDTVSASEGGSIVRAALKATLFGFECEEEFTEYYSRQLGVYDHVRLLMAGLVCFLAAMAHGQKRVYFVYCMSCCFLQTIPTLLCWFRYQEAYVKHRQLGVCSAILTQSFMMPCLIRLGVAVCPRALMESSSFYQAKWMPLLAVVRTLQFQVKFCCQVWLSVVDASFVTMGAFVSAGYPINLRHVLCYMVTFVLGAWATSITADLLARIQFLRMKHLERLSPNTCCVHKAAA